MYGFEPYKYFQKPANEGPEGGCNDREETETIVTDVGLGIRPFDHSRMIPGIAGRANNIVNISI